jgi:hypothetical protein
MRYVGKTWRLVVLLGLVGSFASGLSGCDSGAGQPAQYKPIESNILKKLGSAGQAQGEAAQGKLPARVQAKKKG